MIAGTRSRVTGPLDAFLAEATTDEYRTVRPAADGAPTSRPATSLRRAALIGLVTLLIGLIVAAALMQNRADESSRRAQRQALLERISVADAANTRLQSDIDLLDAGNRSMQASIDGGAAAEPPAALLEAAAAAPATGPGVRVVIDDAPGADASSLQRVLDRDLQDLVNALWRAGATAVAINGQRLTAQSAIRSAGSVILVDYRPVTAPYTVEAVGAQRAADGQSPSSLQSLLRLLSDQYGLRSTTVRADVALPAGRVRIAPAAEQGSQP